MEPIDHVARWRALVAARADQGRRLDREHGRTDHWAGNRAKRFARLFAARIDDDPLLRLIGPLVDRSATVLDVGAGPGRHTIPLARLAGRVVAVESSESMRAQLVAAIEAEGLSNVAVVPAAWPDAVVDPADVVICSHVVYGVSEIEPFVRRLDAVTRRRCVMVLRHGQREAPLLDLFAEIWGEPRCLAPTHLDLYGVLIQLGILANVGIVPFPQPRGYDSLEDAVAQVLADLLNPASPEAEQAVRRFLADHLVTREGRFVLDAPQAWAVQIWWDKGPCG
ncbi:MAG: class I SAM-dependent methyltransferase [Chloroflexi bacterium]|nr:class I SAM-dependent methyltransferase [Chloroflexota bacterium]